MTGGRKKRRAARTHDSGSDTDAAAEDPTMQLVQYQPQQNDFTKPFLSMLQREGNPYVALQGDGKVGLPSSWPTGCQDEILNLVTAGFIRMESPCRSPSFFVQFNCRS